MPVRTSRPHRGHPTMQVLHRDVKTENVLIDAAGHVRLADLNVAKQHADIADGGRTFTVVGTPFATAPEVSSPFRAPPNGSGVASIQNAAALINCVSTFPDASACPRVAACSNANTCHPSLLVLLCLSPRPAHPLDLRPPARRRCSVARATLSRPTGGRMACYSSSVWPDVLHSLATRRCSRLRYDDS